ncbi:hypothetical protein BJF83_10685 [Nocardiopsis sp. CNR-923]|uniref:DUF2293 domain-containing protein n=1 Tax=Nocardiopsis sp. CNR-923 TaxID=1904965 RepID=UPI00095B56D7|nr:hypothetical protein BJF83_10685 [Nocardiopsis sp. CNR-923]
MSELVTDMAKGVSSTGAVRRAVVASVRHEDTPYDRLLMEGVPRDEARARIADVIDRVLAGWS